MSTRQIQGLSLQAAAKQLSIGRTTLCNQLREAGVFYPNGTLPKPEYIKAGYFAVDTRGYQNGVGIDKQYTATLITGTGLSWLKELLNERSKAA